MTKTRCISIIAALTIGASCGREPATPDRTPPREKRYPFELTLIEDAPGSRVEIAGISIVFDVPVVHQTIPLANRTRVESLTGSRTKKTTETVEEHHFNVFGEWLRIDDGRLRHGARDYGQIAPGDRVRVAGRNGAPIIEVNDARRDPR